MSRSKSPGRQRDRKRHRSIQRYAPAARRRRNTSSISSPVDKRRKMADLSGDEKSRRASFENQPAVASGTGHCEEVGSDS